MAGFQSTSLDKGFAKSDVSVNCSAKWGTIQDGVTLDSNEKILEDKAMKKKIKNDDIHFFKANKLNSICPTPLKGEQYRIITEKQFNAYALILHLLQDNVIEELYLAIYRINEPTVDSLIEFIESGKIKKATFVISSFFNQTKKPEAWAKKLRLYCEVKENCEHVYVHNHSKVLAIRTEGNDNFVFEGSGNMSDNARVEQYLYENCKESFEFHKNWMVELVKKINYGSK